jgi:myosin heavy subunit
MSEILTRLFGLRPRRRVVDQLIGGANAADAEMLELLSESTPFLYVTPGADPAAALPAAVGGAAEAEAFTETRACLGDIGLLDAEVTAIFSLLAAILHLGNIAFEESDSGESSSAVVEGSALPKAATLLGVSSSTLPAALCTRQLIVQGKPIVQPQSVAQATEKRDALSKALYAQMFVWLVNKLNTTISAEKSSAFIGVLDIYGFEVFEENSFEQARRLRSGVPWRPPHHARTS